MADIEIKRVPRIDVKKAGTLVGTRPAINLIEGSNVTLTVADDSAGNEVDVTVAGGIPYLYIGINGAEAFTGALSFDGDTILKRVALVGTGGGLGSTTQATFVGCAALERIKAFDSSIATLDFTGCVALTYAGVYSNALTTLTTTGASALAFLDASTNPSLASVDISSNIAITTLYLSGCALDQANVDGVLADLDSAGLSNGEVDLSAGTNSAPSAAGLTSKASLEGKGWTVTVNP